MNLQRMSKSCRPFITDLHGSIHFAAVEHEEEEVQVASCRLPGHVFHFIDEELGGTQSQGCVHHPSPEKNDTVTDLCFEMSNDDVVQTATTKTGSHLAKLKASSIICARLITGIS